MNDDYCEVRDTINVTVNLVNDSAILPNGSSINCLFEDQLFWKIDTFPDF